MTKLIHAAFMAFILAICGFPAFSQDLSSATTGESGSPDQIAWSVSTSPAEWLSTGETHEGLRLNEDHSVSLGGSRIMDPAPFPGRTEVAIHPSPDGRRYIAIQTYQRAGVRFALVDATSGMASGMDAIPHSRMYGLPGSTNVIQLGGVVAWSGNSNLSMIVRSPAVYESDGLLVEASTGEVRLVAPELGQGEWAGLRLNTVRPTGEAGAHSVSFDVARCRDVDCEDFGKVREEVVRFAEMAPVTRPQDEEDVPDQVAMLARLKDGSYGANPDLCGLVQDDDYERASRQVRFISKPTFSLGYELSCTIRQAEDVQDSLRITAACDAEGYSYEQTHLWKITSETSFTDMSSAGGPRDFVLCEEQEETATETGSDWTAAIVPDQSVSRKVPSECYFDIGIAAQCLEDAGARPEAVEFVSWMESSALEISGFIPSYFLETGKVDLVWFNSGGSAGDIVHFLNVAEEGVAYPDHRELPLTQIAGFGDRTAASILRQYPDATPWHHAVTGMRLLPTGNQLFSITLSYTEFCRACPIVAQDIATVEFDRTGRARGWTSQGLFDNRPFRGHDAAPLRLTASDLRRNPVLVQRHLNLRGYNAGPMDGAIGPMTRNAVAEFQSENGINGGTGQLDDRTLAALADSETMFTNGVEANGFVAEAPPPGSRGAQKDLVSPGVSTGLYRAPDPWRWALLASRRTLSEARDFAARYENTRIFHSENGWYAITGGLIDPSEPEFGLRGMLRYLDWPADSMVVAGESFVTELPARAGDPVPAPAFYRTEVIRDTDRLIRSWRNDEPVYDPVGRIEAGRDIVVFFHAAQSETGDCLISGHEAELVKCSDLSAHAGDGMTVTENLEVAADDPAIPRVVREAGPGNELAVDLEAGVYATLPAACPLLDDESRDERERISARSRVTLRDGVFSQGDRTCPIAAFSRTGDESHLEMDCASGGMPVAYRFEMEPQDRTSFLRYGNIYTLCSESAALAAGPNRLERLSETSILLSEFKADNPDLYNELSSLAGDEVLGLVLEELKIDLGANYNEVWSSPFYSVLLEGFAKVMLSRDVREVMRHVGFPDTSYIREFDWPSAGEVRGMGYELAFDYLYDYWIEAIETGLDRYDQPWDGGAFEGFFDAAIPAALSKGKFVFTSLSDYNRGNYVELAVGIFMESASVTSDLYEAARVYREVQYINRDTVDKAIAGATAAIGLQQSMGTGGIRLPMLYSADLNNISQPLMNDRQAWTVDTGRKLRIIGELVLIRSLQLEGRDISGQVETLNTLISDYEGTPISVLDSHADTVTFGALGTKEYAVFTRDVAIEIGLYIP